jgi:RimJ/RimL family protein N-acetyltransferase
MSAYKSFETERLLLKPMSKEDASFLLELLNLPKWIKYIGDRNVYTIKEAETYIKHKMTPQLKKLGFSSYTVIRKTDNAKVGSCGLYDREALEGIDLGFAFLPLYEKMGYAFESANKLKDLAFNQFNLKHISAITTSENKDSQKLLNFV